MTDYAQRLLEFETRRSDRELDLAYLQLTVALVLLIVLIYYATRYFAAARGVQRPGPGFDIATPAAPPPSFKVPPPLVERLTMGTPSLSNEGKPSFASADAEVAREGFAPYASILTPDVMRSDAASDHSERTAQPQWYDQRSSENMLFNQLQSISLATPL